MPYKGYCKLEHPEKYKGKLSEKGVRYLSLWERNAIKTFDSSSSVLAWLAPTGGHDVTIPYISPIDEKLHRYVPDFLVKFNTRNGIVKYLIEVKPQNQVDKPKLPKSGRKTKRYRNAVITWLVNQAKWAAAEEWCIQTGYVFKIMTEDQCT